MNSCRLSKPLLVGALVFAAMGGADARPSTSPFEPGHVTFSSASGADAVIHPGFDLSNTSTVEGDEFVDGSLHRTTRFGEPSNGLHGGVAYKVTRHEKHGGPGAAPVSAIPEPPTLALLAAGLAGVIVVARRRRPRGR